MPPVMEALLWVWVTRMLQPLAVVVQPHKVTVFDWAPAHWAEMEQQSKVAAQARYVALQAAKSEKQRQAAVKLVRAKRLEDDAIGTFDL